MGIRDYLAILFACFNLAFVVKILSSACRYQSNGIVGFPLFLRFVITATIVPLLALVAKMPLPGAILIHNESLLTATAFFSYAFFTNFAFTAFGRFKKNRFIVLSLSYLVPLAGGLIALSNGWTHAFFTDPEAASDVLFFMSRDAEGTPLLSVFAWCMIATLAVLAAVALFSPVRAIRGARRLNLTMIVSMLFPFCGDLLHRAIPLLSGIGLSYFAFSITAFIIYQNYWAYLPHSRRTAAELISSFYMVFDTHGRCTDINLQGQEFFAGHGVRCHPALKNLSDLSGIPIDFLLAREREDFELITENPGGEGPKRYYRMQAFPVRPGPIPGNGRGFLITDMTSYRSREDSLADVANRDALTQVYNRRFFNTYFEQLKTKHAGTDISILMIDGDHFKSINDTYGHLAGDEVLKTIASRCRSCLRTSDIICRFGGEEFVVLLGGTPRAGMEIVANRILHAIADNPFVFEMTRTSRGLVTVEEMSINVTISIGAYSAVLAPDTLVATLIEHADAAMYRAKEAGRNRLIWEDGKTGG
jgi:diguanylate cyclase (GGDEF)-like protein